MHIFRRSAFVAVFILFFIAPMSASASAPALSSISPTSVSSGTQTTLTGSGLLSQNNIIILDGHYSPGALHSSSDTTFTFTLGATVIDLNQCVGNVQPLSCTPASIPITAGVHTIAIQNANGTSSALAFTFIASTSTRSSSVPPTCAISVNPAQIPIGGSVTVTWQSQNATAASITNIGTVGTPKGSVNLLPPQTTTYIGTFTGPGGSARCTATVVMSALYSGGGGLGGGTIIPVSQTQTNTQGSASQSSPTGGLVSCTGLNCRFCDIAALIQNIINFVIGFSFPLAIALFAYAGFLFFTSNTSQERIQKAKSVFQSVVVGFLIVLAGWLLIDTMLHALLKPGFFNNAGGNWYTIQCVAPLITCAPGAAPSQTCSVADVLNQLSYTPTPPAINTNVSCSDSSCNNVIQAIYAQESVSGANVGGSSGCNAAGACGPYQIRPSTACSTNPNIAGCSGLTANADGSVTENTSSSLAQVQSYLQNTADSQNLATVILNQNINSPQCNGNLACGLALYNGGMAALQPSTSCSSGAAFACPYDSPSHAQNCNTSSPSSDCTPTKYETYKYVQVITSKLGQTSSPS